MLFKVIVTNCTLSIVVNQQKGESTFKTIVFFSKNKITAPPNIIDLINHHIF